MGVPSRSPGGWDVRHLPFTDGGPKVRQSDAQNRLLAAEQGNVWVKIDLYGIHLHTFLDKKTAVETAYLIL